MLLLVRQGGRRATGTQNVIVLFGLGLIGTHILKSLFEYNYTSIAEIPFTWNDPSSQKQEIVKISNEINTLFEQSLTFDARGAHPILDVVWSAGVGGFGMTEEEATRECQNFLAVLQFASNIASSKRKPFVRFHLVSSGGGLFEGQVGVSLKTPPEPKRCYGRLKLYQEQVLLETRNLCWLIYRPSSVYGFSGTGKRLGLIPTLLINGTRYQVSTIFGAPDTLRDYVPANDVGRFIARVLSSEQNEPETFHLVAGVSRSLNDVKKITEQAINRKLYVCYRDNLSDNTANINFSQNSLPKNWEPSCIETTIRTMLYEVVSESGENRTLSWLQRS